MGEVYLAEDTKLNRQVALKILTSDFETDVERILFVNTLGTTSNVWLQPLDGTKSTPLTTFKEFQIAAFALNDDGNRLAIARGSRNQDIVLIKNLRN